MGDKNEADSELRKSLVPDQHGGSRQKKERRDVIKAMRLKQNNLTGVQSRELA